MKKIYLTALLLAVSFFECFASENEANLIQRAELYYNTTKTVCSNISDSISQISGVAKANTAISAVGTATGAGALTVGLVKTEVDSRIQDLTEQLCDLGACDSNSIQNMSDEQVLQAATTISEISKISEEIKTKEKQSKTLGDWRTGLIAGNVATNIATAIIAGVNKDKSDLIQQIQACNESVKQTNNIYQELKKAGVNPIVNPIVNKLDSIVTRCVNLSIEDIEEIEKKMTAVMGTSIAGAAIGTAGVTVSASANSATIRNGDENKEKTLNTTANVLSGVGAATSVVGLGLSASMINTAKDMIKQSERCEEVLK